MAPRKQNTDTANELKKITAEYKKLLDEIKKMTAQIAKMAPGGAQVDMKDQIRQAEILRRQYEEIMGLIRQSNSEMAQAMNFRKDYVKTLQDILSGTKDILTTEIRQSDHAASLQKEKKDMLTYLWKHRTVMTGQHKEDLLHKLKQLRLQGDLMARLEDEINLRKRKLDISRAGLEQFQQLGLDIAGNIESAINKLPGGKYISKLLGADQLKKDFQKAFNEGINAFLAPGGTVTEGVAAFKKGLKGVNLAAMGLAIALGLAVTTLKALQDSAKKMAETMGISRAHAFEIDEAIRRRAPIEHTSLVNNQELRDALASQVEEMGQMLDISTATVAKTAQLGEAFGYGAKLASQVSMDLMVMGNVTPEVAGNMQAFAAAMAEAHGLAPGKMMKDLQKNGKLLSKWMAGNAKQMIKTAFAAAKLGMSVSDMSKVADGLLDIEGSLTKQYEAQALMGRAMNFDTARQLVLDGKIADATESILDQAGSYNDLLKMRPYTLQKLAAAAEMEPDALLRAAALRDKLGHLTDEEMANVSKLGLSHAAINDLQADQIRQRASENAQFEKISGTMEQLSNQVIQAFLPAMKLIGAILEYAIVPLVEGLMWPFRQIGNFIAWISDKFGGLIGDGKAFAGIAEWIKNTFIGIGMVLGAVIIPAMGVMLARGIANIPVLLANLAKWMGIGAAATWVSSAAMPLLIGVPIAIAAIAGFITLVNRAQNVKQGGDLGIDPNGGPVVSSPQMDGVFQGKKGDGLSMGSQFGTTPDMGGSSISYDSPVLKEMLNELKAMKSAFVESANTPSVAILDSQTPLMIQSMNADDNTFDITRS